MPPTLALSEYGVIRPESHGANLSEGTIAWPPLTGTRDQTLIRVESTAVILVSVLLSMALNGRALNRCNAKRPAPEPGLLYHTGFKEQTAQPCVKGRGLLIGVYLVLA